jgi:hypothetical protein
VDDTANIYPGGFAGLLKRQEKRQRRFDGIETVLPPVDVALGPLFEAPVATPPGPPESAPRYSALRKWLELQGYFEGQPQALHLHAMLIAISRRDDPPALALDLFFRLWTEEGARLVALLTPRWLISSATTFSDHGRTGDQRALGMGLSVLFDMIKLHDSERRISGKPGRTPFRGTKDGKTFPLAFDLTPYAYRGGDLDKILLARLWQLAERDAVIRPLGFAMLRLVMTEPRSIFGRTQEMKKIIRGEA